MKLWLCLALVVAAVLALTACSDDDGDSAAKPRADTSATTSERAGADGPAVARVGDTEISQAAYERLVRRAAAGYAKARTYPGRRYYVPPTYALCIRNRREWGSVPKSWPAARVRIQCRHNHRRLRTSLLTFLIEDEWIKKEAAKQGLEPPSDETERVTQFPTELAQAAVDSADMTISDAEIARYYRSHRSWLRRPEERNWRTVLSETEEQAGNARRALEQGVAWEKVARRYGDPESGAAPQDWIANPENNELAVTKAIFGASKGELVGPVKSANGFYVFTVERITPPHQYSLEQARTAIVPVLETRRREQAQIDYWRAVRLAARERTVCPTELTVPDCSNGSRRGFDADGAFGYTNPRPTLPPPKSLPDDSGQSNGEPPPLP